MEVMVPRKEEEGLQFREKISSAIDFASDVIDCIIEGDNEDTNGKLETSIQVETNGGTSRGKRFLNELESVINGNASNAVSLENPSSYSSASNGQVITSPHRTSVGGSQAIPANNVHLPFNGLFAASDAPSDSFTPGFSGLFAASETSDSLTPGFSGLFTASVSHSVSQSGTTASEENRKGKDRTDITHNHSGNVIRQQDEEPAKNEILDEEGYKLFRLFKDGTKELINFNRLEGSEEEEIELEFESAVENLDQHRVHCPKCNAIITKVVLRKKRRPSPIPSPWKDYLFGCLSCFSIFIPRGALKFINLGYIRFLFLLVGTNSENFLPCSNYYNEIVHMVVKHNAGSDPPGNSQLPEIVVPLPPGPDNSYETIGSKRVEILKSIVYGGLMELITSLSVVSSAAAADATTANIVAIGLANLIGGLFVLGPNLRELKNDYSGQVDRYKELLGRRENFLLHATVVVLSFLVFGLIPPVTYGFSFRQSHDMDLKLLAVAAASLLCIAILAIGKAYIQKQSKFLSYVKTVLYYVSMAVTGSGISYAVGDSIKRLVQQLGWFDSSAAVSMSLPQVGSVNPAWGSY